MAPKRKRGTGSTSSNKKKKFSDDEFSDEDKDLESDDEDFMDSKLSKKKKTNSSTIIKDELGATVEDEEDDIDPESLTVFQLRKELQKRKEKSTGSKKELVERLTEVLKRNKSTSTKQASETTSEYFANTQNNNNNNNAGNQQSKRFMPDWNAKPKVERRTRKKEKPPTPESTPPTSDAETNPHPPSKKNDTETSLNQSLNETNDVNNTTITEENSNVHESSNSFFSDGEEADVLHNVNNNNKQKLVSKTTRENIMLGSLSTTKEKQLDSPNRISIPSKKTASSSIPSLTSPSSSGWINKKRSPPHMSPIITSNKLTSLDDDELSGEANLESLITSDLSSSSSGKIKSPTFDHSPIPILTKSNHKLEIDSPIITGIKVGRKQSASRIITTPSNSTSRLTNSNDAVRPTSTSNPTLLKPNSNPEIYAKLKLDETKSLDSSKGSDIILRSPAEYQLSEVGTFPSSQKLNRKIRKASLPHGSDDDNNDEEEENDDFKEGTTLPIGMEEDESEEDEIEPKTSSSTKKPSSSNSNNSSSNKSLTTATIPIDYDDDDNNNGDDDNNRKIINNKTNNNTKKKNNAIKQTTKRNNNNNQRTAIDDATQQVDYDNQIGTIEVNFDDVSPPPPNSKNKNNNNKNKAKASNVRSKKNRSTPGSAGDDDDDENCGRNISSTLNVNYEEDGESIPTGTMNVDYDEDGGGDESIPTRTTNDDIGSTQCVDYNEGGAPGTMNVDYDEDDDVDSGGEESAPCTLNVNYDDIGSTQCVDYNEESSSPIKLTQNKKKKMNHGMKKKKEKEIAPTMEVDFDDNGSDGDDNNDDDEVMADHSDGGEEFKNTQPVDYDSTSSPISSNNSQRRKRGENNVEMSSGEPQCTQCVNYDEDETSQPIDISPIKPKRKTQNRNHRSQESKSGGEEEGEDAQLLGTQPVNYEDTSSPGTPVKPKKKRSNTSLNNNNEDSSMYDSDNSTKNTSPSPLSPSPPHVTASSRLNNHKNNGSETGDRSNRNIVDFFADIQNNIKFTRPGRLVPIGGNQITPILVDYPLCLFLRNDAVNRKETITEFKRYEGVDRNEICKLTFVKRTMSLEVEDLSSAIKINNILIGKGKRAILTFGDELSVEYSKKKIHSFIYAK